MRSAVVCLALVLAVTLGVVKGDYCGPWPVLPISDVELAGESPPAASLFP